MVPTHLHSFVRLFEMDSSLFGFFDSQKIKKNVRGALRRSTLRAREGGILTGFC